MGQISIPCKVKPITPSDNINILIDRSSEEAWCTRNTIFVKSLAQSTLLHCLHNIFPHLFPATAKSILKAFNIICFALFVPFFIPF